MRDRESLNEIFFLMKIKCMKNAELWYMVSCGGLNC